MTSFAVLLLTLVAIGIIWVVVLWNSSNNVANGDPITVEIKKGEGIREIAEKKLKDLNANTVEAAMKIIEGSARSMGVDVK